MQGTRAARSFLRTSHKRPKMLSMIMPQNELHAELKSQPREKIEIRDCGLFMYSWFPQYFKYRIGSGVECCATVLSGNIAKELKETLCQDPTIAPLVRTYNLTIIFENLCGFVSMIFLSLIAMRLLGLPPAMFLVEFYPNGSAIGFVFGLLCIGITQLLKNDHYRGLKRMIALYNNPPE
jgi:hypothetical protein